MSSDQLGSLAARLDVARAGRQAWLEWMFGNRLPRTTIARRRAIQALHAATDVYTWKLLRRDLRQTREDTERIMRDLVTGVLIGRSGPRVRSRRRAER